MRKPFDEAGCKAMARKATTLASQYVLSTYRVPLVGSLKCVFVGAVGDRKSGNPICWNTSVSFRWEYHYLPHVKGAVVRSIPAYRVATDLRRRNIMPPSLKAPLLAAFCYKKFDGTLRLPKMKRYAGAKVQLLAISSPVTKPFEKTSLKRRVGPNVQSPICAHIHGDSYIACAPNPNANAYHRFAVRDLRVVIVGARLCKMKAKRSTAPVGAAVGDLKLQLPGTLSEYDRKPWRCLRDVAAVATWRAEEMRAAASGKPVSLKVATSKMVPSPFEWKPRDKTVFIVWTSEREDKQGGPVRYHLASASLQYLVKMLAKAEE